MSQLVKLSIKRCIVESDGTITVSGDPPFSVMLNPSKYSHGYEIAYDEKDALGQSGSMTRFAAVRPETISFDITLDGTGVVSPSAPDVKTQLLKLKGVIYKYNGESHEPNHVRVLWGSLIFFGRLTSMSAEYTLFKPSGEPLRAAIKLSFRGFMSKEEEQLRAQRSSPDLTHTVEIRAGDSLPLLCYRIYRDAAYYPQVAQFNGIVNFRDLRPGMRVHFPPLE